MKHKLNEQHVDAIEKAINENGVTEAIVKIENGKIKILLSRKTQLI